MNTQEAIRINIEMGDFVSVAYLADLTDAELMLRPHAGCNHINWQVGHLISSDQHHINNVAPGALPPLPAGFAQKYSKETAGNNDPKAFCTKDELLALHKQQLAAILAALAKTTDDELSKPTGVEYAPTVGAIYSLVGSHWLMHAGQWVVVRRQLGKPALF